MITTALILSLLLLLLAAPTKAFTVGPAGRSLCLSSPSYQGSRLFLSKKNRSKASESASQGDEDDFARNSASSGTTSNTSPKSSENGADDLSESLSELSDAMGDAAIAAAEDGIAMIDDEVTVDESLPSQAASGDRKNHEQSAGASSPSTSVADDKASSLSTEQTDLISYIQSLGAITGRGEYASKKQKESAMDVIYKLEASNPTPQPTLSPFIQGRWELLYSSTQLFRGSPFFMAGRSVCSTEQQAKQYNWFCDMHRKALAMSTIVGVRQIVSSNKLISEFEVKAGTVPFLNDFTPFSYSGGLPVSIDGAIVSTADLEALGSAWRLYMDTVEIKGSNVPGLRQLLDGGMKLQSRTLGDFLEANIDSYSNPRPAFRTTFLSKQFRISRDEDDHAFVYVKTSDSTEPTDYSNVDSDLGIGKLLEGFNDAVTRIYL